MRFYLAPMEGITGYVFRQAHHKSYEAFDNTEIPLCYNGDILSVDDVCRISESFPEINAIMIGRGILKNPNLLNEIKGDKSDSNERLISFHDRLLKGYVSDLKNDRDVLFKMKELWAYLGESFKDNPDYDKLINKIRKSSNISEYNAAAMKLISKKVN